MGKPLRTCPECLAPFEVTNGRKLFCEPAHGIAYNNRQLGRGQAALGLAMAWRAGRHKTAPADKKAAAAAFRELCRTLDRYAAEDKLAGRAHPLRVFRARTAMGLLED